MSPDFEATVTQALIDAGGPPELAPQLVAMAEQKGTPALLLSWIRFHIEPEWSAMQFDQWLIKFIETAQRLNLENKS